MKKMTTIALFLSLLIVTVGSVTAYQAISIQTQNATTEVEVTSEGSDSTIKIENSGEQLQRQRFFSNTKTETKTTNTNRAPEKTMVRTTTETEVRTEPKLRASMSPRPSSSPRPNTVQNCEAIKERVESHMTEFKNSYDQREAVFKRVYQTVLELIARLEANNVDVTQLQTAADNLQAARMQLLTALDGYLTAAENVQNLSCTATPEERKAAFDRLKTARDTYQAAAKEVIEVINTEVKPALQAVRSSVENS